MGITEPEQERFDRARRRIMNAGLDDLTVESTATALSLSEAALDKAAPDIRLLAEAVAGQAVAFAHFVSGAQRAATSAAASAAASVAEAAIAKHAKECGAAKTPHGFVEGSKQALLSKPIALSAFLCVCVWKFGDKLFAVFFQ